MKMLKFQDGSGMNPSEEHIMGDVLEMNERRQMEMLGHAEKRNSDHVKECLGWRNQDVDNEAK